MIVATFAALALQSALQRDAPALINQSTDRIIRSYGDMAVALGKCSTIYPGGTTHPYVLKARQDVQDFGVEELTVQTQRVESILYAEAAQQAGDRNLTVAACAEMIEEPAKLVSVHADGLRDLLARLERDAAGR